VVWAEFQAGSVQYRAAKAEPAGARSEMRGLLRRVPAPVAGRAAPALAVLPYVMQTLIGSGRRCNLSLRRSGLWLMKCRCAPTVRRRAAN